MGDVGFIGVQPPSLPNLQSTAPSRLGWFKGSLPQARTKAAVWFSPDQTTHWPFPDEPLEAEEKCVTFFVQTPGPLLYIQSLEAWITHAKAFMQIKCCAPLWKIASKNMVQMMQIQGMWYGVEKSLKSLLQEISLKIVVCAGNSHPGSLPESKISFVCPWEWNSQSSFRILPFTFWSLNCYPQSK